MFFESSFFVVLFSQCAFFDDAFSLSTQQHTLKKRDDTTMRRCLFVNRRRDDFKKSHFVSLRVEKEKKKKIGRRL